MGNIILNIPHSSINGIFDKEIGGWHENPFFINGPVREHTDWFTDMLFTIQGIKVLMTSFRQSLIIPVLCAMWKD